MRHNRSQRLLVLCCSVAAAAAIAVAPAADSQAFVPPGPRPDARDQAHDVAKAVTAGGGAHPQDDPAYLPGRLLVGFDPEAGPRSRARALAAVAARPIGRAGAATVVSVRHGVDAGAAAARLSAQPGVDFAAPDYLRAAHGCGDCWQLEPGRRHGGKGGFGTGATALHAAGTRGQGSVVAVLDSGIMDIPELAGKVVARRTCLHGGSLTGCRPGAGVGSPHGTMVASLIAARDDDVGITGIAPAARIKSWQVDGGSEISSSAIVAALDEAIADPQVDVINMSFGGPAFSSAELAAVRRARDAGKTLVASAGNDGSYLPQYPAAYPGVISVGAIDAAGEVAGFSSFGKVDLVAPGVCLPVNTPPRWAIPRYPGCATTTRPGISLVSGTSFAAPLVSGVLALRRSGSPWRDRLGLAGTAAPLRPTPVCTTLRCPLGDPAGEDRKRWGHGLVDALAWEASFAPAARPYLIVEAEPQLMGVAAEPGTAPEPVTWRAYLLRSGGPVVAPAAAQFNGQVTGKAGFVEVEPGAWLAELDGTAPGADLSGSGLQTVTAAGVVATGAVRVLRPDDQAPGVRLAGSGPWYLRDTLQGGGTGPTASADIDDVRSIRLRAGQTIQAELRGSPGQAIGAALFTPGTTDVLGRLDRIAASSGRPDANGVARLTYTVPVDGDWLLDVYAQGLESDAPASGAYSLAVSVSDPASQRAVSVVTPKPPRRDGKPGGRGRTRPRPVFEAPSPAPRRVPFGNW